MLPRPHRLTRPEDFRRTIRGGRKAVAVSVVVHGLLPAMDAAAGEPARVGVTVSKAVGGSVVRHRVARQIRHAVAREWDRLPAGSTWVIRALPEAADSSRVAGDVLHAMEQVLTGKPR